MRKIRVPVRHSVQDDGLLWQITRKDAVPVHQVVSIVGAVPGIDYPIDGPARMNRDFLVVLMQDSSRSPLR